MWEALATVALRRTEWSRCLELTLQLVRAPTVHGRAWQLCERLASDLQRKGYLAQTLGIKLRFDDFRRVSRDVTLPAPIADAQAIRQAAGSCLKRVDLSRRLRLIGVRAAGLVQASAAASAGAVVPRTHGVAQHPAPMTHKWQGDLPFLSASDDGTA